MVFEILPNYAELIHVQYNEYKASIFIESLGILEGKLPGRIYSIVAEWAMEHTNELLDNWNELKETGRFHKIKPLV